LLLAVPSPYWIVRVCGVGVTFTESDTVKGTVPAVGDTLHVRETGPEVTGVGVVVSVSHPTRPRQSTAAADRAA
jgi:hypothetical protein